MLGTLNGLLAAEGLSCPVRGNTNSGFHRDHWRRRFDRLALRTLLTITDIRLRAMIPGKLAVSGSMYHHVSVTNKTTSAQGTRQN